jgi:hypothetical protein
MTAPPLSDLDGLDRDITRALAALRRVRLACARSGDPDAAREAVDAEWRLNQLLDRRLAATRGDRRS